MFLATAEQTSTICGHSPSANGDQQGLGKHGVTGAHVARRFRIFSRGCQEPKGTHLHVKPGFSVLA
jgi:hypothetical protein